MLFACEQEGASSGTISFMCDITEFADVKIAMQDVSVKNSLLPASQSVFLEYFMSDDDRRIERTPAAADSTRLAWFLFSKCHRAML